MAPLQPVSAAFQHILAQKMDRDQDAADQSDDDDRR